MQCPVCSEVALVMAERQGIEIDYCPRCRGVWLDRGELDKIIERSLSESPAPRQAAAAPPRSERQRDDERNDDYHYHKKRKRGLLGDLFDFD